MAVRIDPHWSYRGLPAVRMENRHMAVEVLPDAGAKVFRLIDKAADRNVLWENFRIPPHRTQIFASIDDHWSGGWDEAFPTGAPSTDRYGEASPYLGELWSAASWKWRVVDTGPREVSLECSLETPITPARYTRTLTLAEDSPVLRSRIRLEHVGTLPFDYLLGTHPSLAVTPNHRFDVPVRDVLVDEFGGECRLGERGDRYTWPFLTLRDGTKVDVRRIAGPELKSFALHFCTPLLAGWTACTDTASKRGFGLVFDKDVLRVVWLWQVFGGWRGYYHVAMEAWTSAPGALADAVKAGTARVMNPGESIETEVSAVLYGGVDSVGGLEADGSVTPAKD